MNRLPISCCYIVRNEVLFLEASLTSVAPWIEELILLDSGSTDNTEEIAKKFKNLVPKFRWETQTWKDDYSFARNKCAELASEPWVLFVDGDEVLDIEAPNVLSTLIKDDSIGCYSLIQRNYTYDAAIEGSQKVLSSPPRLETQFLNQNLFYFDNHMERLMKKRLQLKYTGRIHESLIPDCREKKIAWKKSSLVLHHYGRLKPKQREKLLYYQQLSELKLKESPSDPVSWIEYLVSLVELSDLKKAYNFALKAHEQFKNTSADILKICAKIALQASDYAKAEEWLRELLRLDSSSEEAKTYLATSLLYQQKFEDMISVCTEVLKINSNNFVAHLNLAVVFFERKLWTDALRHLETAQKLRPHDQFVSQAIEKIRQTTQTN